MDDNSFLKIVDNVSRDLVRYSYFSSGELPPKCMQVAEYSFFDWLVVSAAGSKEPVTKKIQQFVQNEGGNQTSSVLGLNIKISSNFEASVKTYEL